MKYKKHNIDEIWYELNGVLFPDENSAIAAAKASILQKLAADYLNNECRLVKTGFEIHKAIEPIGCKTVVSICLVRRCEDTPVRPAGEGLFLSIRQVRPNSPLHGKYIAKFWDLEELRWWCQFDYYQTSDQVITHDEVFYGNVAITVSRCLTGQDSIDQLLEDLRGNWLKATDELERNRIAETFLCGQDLELFHGFSFHELLVRIPDLVSRASDLAMIREEARLFGAAIRE